MAKPQFFADVIRPGREQDYRDFWERGLNRNVAGELLTADLVAFVEPIRASNQREAKMLARARHPAHEIGRVGRAMRNPLARARRRGESST